LRRGHAAHFTLAGALADVRRDDQGRRARHVASLCMRARMACRATRRALAAIVIAGALVLTVGAALEVFKHVHREVGEARNLERQNDSDSLHDAEHRSSGAPEARAHPRHARACLMALGVPSARHAQRIRADDEPASMA